MTETLVRLAASNEPGRLTGRGVARETRLRATRATARSERNEKVNYKLARSPKRNRRFSHFGQLNAIN